jgi:hypothetical protein
MILSDLASPAEASSRSPIYLRCFAKAGNRYPLFGIMLQRIVPAATITVEVCSESRWVSTVIHSAATNAQARTTNATHLTIPTPPYMRRCAFTNEALRR